MNCHCSANMTALKDLVVPIVKLSHFCTLAPFVIVKNAKSYAPIRRCSLYLIRLIVLIILLETMYVQMALKIPTPTKEINGIVITAVRFGVFYLMLLTFPIYLIATFLNSHKIANYMNNLKQIGVQMEAIGLRMNFRRKYKLHMLQIGWKLFEMLLSFLCFICEVSDGSVAQLLGLVIFTVPLIMTYVVLLQWATFVSLLGMHFKGLNEFLKALKYRQCFIIEDFPKVKRKPLIEVIEECGAIYDRLCDESKRLNEAYAWQILCLIPHYFLITLSNIYNALLAFKNDTPFSAKILMNGLLGGLYLVEFVLPCALCKEEAGRFSEILNKVDLKLQKSPEIEDVVSGFMRVLI